LLSFWSRCCSHITCRWACGRAKTSVRGTADWPHWWNAHSLTCLPLWQGRAAGLARHLRFYNLSTSASPVRVSPICALAKLSHCATAMPSVGVLSALVPPTRTAPLVRAKRTQATAVSSRTLNRDVVPLGAALRSRKRSGGHYGGCVAYMPRNPPLAEPHGCCVHATDDGSPCAALQQLCLCPAARCVQECCVAAGAPAQLTPCHSPCRLPRCSLPSGSFCGPIRSAARCWAPPRCAPLHHDTFAASCYPQELTPPSAPCFLVACRLSCARYPRTRH